MSETASAEQKRKFEEVKDPDEAVKLLREGGRTFSSAMIWTDKQEHVINTHLHLFSEASKALYTHIPKNFDAKQFMDDIAKKGVHHCYFSVSLQRANIFFKCDFMGIDKGGLKFKAPEKIYKVQRRSHLRFTVPDTLSLKVEFPDPVFPETRISKKVIDISAGGAAIAVREDESVIFTQDLVLNGLVVKLKGRDIRCDGEVRHISKIPPGGRHIGIKIGIQFKNLRRAEQDFIASFVFEEHRKFFSQFFR